VTNEFLALWIAGVVLAAVALRFFYARDERVARICFWVLLSIFITPVGAVLFYVLLSVITKSRDPMFRPVIEK
jgi:phage shock protein PspC (stress-responsive transcriptional regulator)